MMRTLVLALVLAGGLTACGGSSTTQTETVANDPSPSATGAEGGTGTCSPSGTGTTDLKTKPVYTVSKAPAPKVTTIIDVVCGSGKAVASGSMVTMKYVGVNYADGKQFDSSWDRAAPDDVFSFSVGSGQVVPGFDKAALGMKVGGRREVIVTPTDGYGPRGSGPIGPNETLVFLVDLVSVS